MNVVDYGFKGRQSCKDLDDWILGCILMSSLWVDVLLQVPNSY